MVSTSWQAKEGTSELLRTNGIAHLICTPRRLVGAAWMKEVEILIMLFYCLFRNLPLILETS